jgi:hypothetical protein
MKVIDAPEQAPADVSVSEGSLKIYVGSVGMTVHDPMVAPPTVLRVTMVPAESVVTHRTSNADATSVADVSETSGAKRLIARIFVIYLNT